MHTAILVSMCIFKLRLTKMANAANVAAQEIRDDFKKYVNGAGAVLVSWQQNRIGLEKKQPNTICFSIFIAVTVDVAVPSCNGS